jgi:hypothetical protein
LSGCFVAFVPRQIGDGVGHNEDGFAARLSDASFAAVRDLLPRGRSMAFDPRPGDQRLIIEGVP